MIKSADQRDPFLEAEHMLLTLQCPKCKSNDISRSRRKLWERVVLFVLKAQVYRCRDCRRRFWVGVEWGGVILGTLTVVVVAGVALTMVAVHQNQEKAAAAATALPKARKRRRLPPLPKGLPPLSSIPSTVGKTDASDKADEIDAK
jgi:ribosomal protein L37AE/L43A